jgi:hypothetical protein
MPNEAVKKRLERAKKKAIEHFTKTGYKIIESNNKTFCFIATRSREVRFIRVVVDRITETDIQSVWEILLPESCTREIFCQKKNDFEIREIEK